MRMRSLLHYFALSILPLLCAPTTSMQNLRAQTPAKSAAAVQPPMRSIGKIERFKPEFDALIPADAKLEVLADGFTWTEGPLWMGDKDNGYLLFTDIPRNSIFSWSKFHGISLFMNPSGYTGVTYYGLEPGANGLLKDSDGNLVMCEHGDRRVSVLTPNGGKRTLADNYQGKRLNSPNDGTLKSNGDIYFTDPPYGLPQRENDPRRELDHFGVYRISKKTGELSLMTTELARPNGIGFSPDEKTLYVAQSDPKKAIWMAFPVKDDGTLGSGKLFYDATDQVGVHPGLPDGLSVDKKREHLGQRPRGYLCVQQRRRIARASLHRRTHEQLLLRRRWVNPIYHRR